MKPWDISTDLVVASLKQPSQQLNNWDISTWQQLSKQPSPISRITSKSSGRVWMGAHCLCSQRKLGYVLEVKWGMFCMLSLEINWGLFSQPYTSAMVCCQNGPHFTTTHITQLSIPLLKYRVVKVDPIPLFVLSLSLDSKGRGRLNCIV